MTAWRHLHSAALALSPRARNERLLASFVLVSLPAALIAAWQPEAAVTAQPGVRGLLQNAAVAFVTAALWERLFASVRGRAGDSGWIAPAWFYALLLPPALPVAYVAAGMSFGAVFGMHVFGGTGRYVASPAVLGALFLEFAYPSLGGGTLPAAGQVLWPDGGWPPSWPFLVACAAGAAVLVVSDAVSWRTLTGAVAGLVIATSPAIAQGDLLAPVGHAAAGSYAICWAFVLTDPSTQSLTRAGRLLHGAAFSLLVVLIREADPRHPDGVLTAVLLAGLLVPLFDAIAAGIRYRRRGPTLELR